MACRPVIVVRDMRGGVAAADGLNRISSSSPQPFDERLLREHADLLEVDLRYRALIDVLQGLNDTDQPSETLACYALNIYRACLWASRFSLPGFAWSRRPDGGEILGPARTKRSTRADLEFLVAALATFAVDGDAHALGMATLTISPAARETLLAAAATACPGVPALIVMVTPGQLAKAVEQARMAPAARGRRPEPELDHLARTCFAAFVGLRGSGRAWIFSDVNRRVGGNLTEPRGAGLQFCRQIESIFGIAFAAASRLKAAKLPS